MRRLLSIITTITLLFAFIAIPVNAEELQMISLKEAIEIAKEKLELNTEDFKFNSNFSEFYSEGRKVWDLYWYQNVNPGQSISVTVDAATGEIIRFDNWMPSTSTFRKIPKYTKGEALSAAEAYLNKICPEKYDSLELIENINVGLYKPYSDTYTFAYVRKVNDIDFSNNVIVLNIDKDTLKLRNFSASWDQTDFPDPSNTISKNDAKEIFIKNQGIVLSYQLIYAEPNKKPYVKLVYTLNNNQPIDAFTGEFLQNAYYNHPYYGFDTRELATANYGITPQEQKEVEDKSKYISKEQALEAIKNVMPEVENYTLTQAILSSGNNIEGPSWYLYWNASDKGSEKYFYSSASINAITGEIKNFYKDSNDIYQPKEKELKYTEEQGKEIAVDFIKKLQPEKYELTVYKPTNVNISADGYVPTVYHYNFVRKENDLECYFNSMYVSVSAFTGEIVNYNYWWVDVEIPSKENIIDLNSAYNIMFNKSDLVLKYIKQYDYTRGIETSKVKLAYILDNFVDMIDAETGTIIGYDGEPIKENAGVTEFNDISGHKAEEDINNLINIGVIESENNKFNPDSKILQKDFIMMLVKAIEPYSNYPIIYDKASLEDQYDYYYRTAIQKKLISEREKNPDAYVNKQEASRMLIRALGFGYIGEKPNMFILPFDDGKYVLSSYKGYIVLANELGILTAENNKFNAKQLLTNAEAATSIVNFLQVDTNLVD